MKHLLHLNNRIPFPPPQKKRKNCENLSWPNSRHKSKQSGRFTKTGLGTLNGTSQASLGLGLPGWGWWECENWETKLRKCEKLGEPPIINLIYLPFSDSVQKVQNMFQSTFWNHQICFSWRKNENLFHNKALLFHPQAQTTKTPTLSETISSPLQISIPKKDMSSSSHQIFRGAVLVSGRLIQLWDQKNKQKLPCISESTERSKWWCRLRGSQWSQLQPLGGEFLD